MRENFNGGYFDGEVSENGDFVGKIVYDNRDVYTGKVVGGVFSGEVIRHYDYGVYRGEWRDGDKNGKGEFSWFDGDRYDGEWLNGVMHGKGTFKWKSGDVYTGEWKHGVADGKGKITWKSGEWYDGEWRDGMRHGKGVYRNPNANLFNEVWENDERLSYERINKN